MSHRGNSFGETNNAGDEQTRRRKRNIMGDRSPKSVKKQATQKQTRNNSVMQKKSAAETAKQGAGKKN